MKIIFFMIISTISIFALSLMTFAEDTKVLYSYNPKPNIPMLGIDTNIINMIVPLIVLLVVILILIITLIIKKKRK